MCCRQVASWIKQRIHDKSSSLTIVHLEKLEESKLKKKWSEKISQSANSETASKLKKTRFAHFPR